MYRLERIDVESVDVLTSLSHRTFEQAYHDVHSAENIRAYCVDNFSHAQAAKTLGDDQMLCKVAFVDGEPAGFYVLRSAPCPIELPGDAAELKQLYVLSDHYGAGLGRLLFEDAMAVARTKRNRWVWLCVSSRNRRAQRFYQKNGFSVSGSGPTLHVGSDILPSSIMCRELGPSGAMR